MDRIRQLVGGVFDAPAALGGSVALMIPWFAFGFVGALLFTLLAATLHLAAPDRLALPWIIAALILYLATLVITGRVNVPLNNQLATAHADETETDHTAVRAGFEPRWNRWNHVRTLTSTAAFTCLVVALTVG